MIAALLLVAGALGDGNRSWWLEVEARGPLEEFTLDCGADGVTRVRGPFLAGERRLVVPVPVRSPLGVEGLAALALPRCESAAVRVLGWSAEQPDATLARTSRALLVRGRPPIGGAPPRAGRAEAALLLCALPLLVYLRRRVKLASALALALGAFLLWRGARSPAEPQTVELFEVDLAAGRALLVRGARDGLALGPARLEARPDGTALTFEVPSDGGGGRVLAPGVELHALEPAAAPALGPDGSDESLAACWVRAPSGEWSAHGAWGRGQPLPGPVPGAAGPPGWLTGALPPGVGILLARRGGGGWLRATGFELPGQESQDGY